MRWGVLCLPRLVPPCSFWVMRANLSWKIGRRIQKSIAAEKIENWGWISERTFEKWQPLLLVCLEFSSFIIIGTSFEPLREGLGNSWALSLFSMGRKVDLWSFQFTTGDTSWKAFIMVCLWRTSFGTEKEHDSFCWGGQLMTSPTWEHPRPSSFRIPITMIDGRPSNHGVDNDS